MAKKASKKQSLRKAASVAKSHKKARKAAVVAKKKSRKVAADKTAQQEKFERVARMLGSDLSDVEAIAKTTEQTFRSLGKAVEGNNGRITIYARRQIPFTFTKAKHVVKARAMVKDAIDCPIAKAAKDLDSCWLGKHTTSVHVGNVMVTFWSAFCPHIVVKCTLGPQLMAAVRNWDDQVKRKVKNRRFNLADGTYYFSPCWPSTIREPGTPRIKRLEIRGKNINSPTRRLTVKSDIALAVSALAAKSLLRKKK